MTILFSLSFFAIFWEASERFWGEIITTSIPLLVGDTQRHRGVYSFIIDILHFFSLELADAWRRRFEAVHHFPQGIPADTFVHCDNVTIGINMIWNFILILQI